MKRPSEGTSSGGPSVPPSTQDVPRPMQLRFGIGSLLLAMLICSVSAASVFYLVQSVRSEGGESSRQTLIFLGLTLCAPSLLLIVVSVVYAWHSRRAPGRLEHTEREDV